MRRIALYVLLSLLLILFSTTVLRFLAVSDILPDLLLVWIVYIAIREGQIPGMTAGFLIGLLLDLVSGPDGMLGLHALCKSIAGFLAGYFYNENKTIQTLGGYQFIVAVALVSIVHNVVYFLIFLQGTDMQSWKIILRFALPTTVYTAAVGLLPMFVVARKFVS